MARRSDTKAQGKIKKQSASDVLPGTPEKGKNNGKRGGVSKEKVTRAKKRSATPASSPSGAIPPLVEHKGKYLSFSLGNEEFGIGIHKVKEIVGMMPVTKIPGTPPFIAGVVNLRGRVIPVADLRARFGMEEAAGGARKCLVVVEMGSDAGPIPMGIIVDSVSEVVNIKGEDLVAAPEFGVRVNLNYILALAKMNAHVKILLDLDKLLAA